MSTFMAKPAELNRKWYVIDADGKPLGRIAAAAASILRGKIKPTFTPNVDCGDFVIILNAEKAVLTGKKLDQKYYRYHTGYVGGLKEIKYKHLMEEKPEKAVMLAVKGMLPHNTIGAKALTRLRVYKGTEHNHAAQKPEEYTGLIK
ncbi:MAG: 50S ribosomal protein L13 [Clostridia bacterium]|nr:50S ribosomal protein L13 [Clostridia bacterium]